MILIIGLGNPWKKYEKTRHNAGFFALDEFAKINEFPLFKLSKKHSSLVSEGILNSRFNGGQTVKVVLAKPQTFMNNSGKAVASLVKLSFGKLSLTKELAEELIVIHDDIDIPLGKVKVSKGSGSAGHKGVDSIIQSLGTKNFTRIRIGIQPAARKPENIEAFVLQNFTAKEILLLKQAIAEVFTILNTTILRSIAV